MTLSYCRHRGPKLKVSSFPFTLREESDSNDQTSLTALISGFVILDVDLLLAFPGAGAAAHYARPVDGVRVAEIHVSCDVDFAVFYLL